MRPSQVQEDLGAILLPQRLRVELSNWQVAVGLSMLEEILGLCRTEVTERGWVVRSRVGSEWEGRTMESGGRMAVNRRKKLQG
jgi:hypothetical protein